MAKCGFETLGVMIDLSRNAVMNVESLKRFITVLKKMGYNCAMLYTEDTYEVENEEYFGYMRGRYSMNELRELDSFADSIGIELIPCIQTLAHVNAAVRWGKFPTDCEDIMLVDDERTYELIENMFSTISKCFKSRRVHAGMDEALMLGRGKHLDKFGYEDASSIMKRHLARVKKISEKFGYEMMIWSDMYFRTWVENHGYYVKEKVEMPKEIVESYDHDIIPVYWDYYHRDEAIYDAMIYNHQQLSDRIWFAGGVWTWAGFMPALSHSLHTMLPAFRSCKKNGIKNVVLTLWGDCGGECSMFAALPGLHYLAEYSRGNTDEEKIKRRFKSIVGMEYDDFIKLELPNEIHRKLSDPSAPVVNPSKYMLYSDTFLGYLDYTVREGDGDYYAPVAKELYGIAKKSRTYGYLFKTAAKLCEVLSVKYELGLKTRKAYNAGDKAELMRLANNEFKEAIRLMREFGDVYEAQWFRDNKPHGFDIQDLRIGGATRRLEACRRRLIDYVGGKIDSIPELDEKILPYPNTTEGEPFQIMVAEKIFSANVME